MSPRARSARKPSADPDSQVWVRVADGHEDAVRVGAVFITPGGFVENVTYRDAEEAVRAGVLELVDRNGRPT